LYQDHPDWAEPAAATACFSSSEPVFPLQISNQGSARGEGGGDVARNMH